MKKPQPISKESPFGFDELFFSTTNPKGVILFGNDVFVRVSGYPKETMVGAPHSIIRHPDMPRAVFKLLWSTIQAGEPIAAYVKNLSADGSFYWVFAFVFPINDGYLSIRVKPSSALFEAAQAIYEKTLAFENEKDMDASTEFLLSQLQQAGFKTYQEFMIKASFAELGHLQEKNAHEKSNSLHGVIGEISQLSSESSAKLKEAFERIQGFQESNRSFMTTMSNLSEAFQHLKYIALNMTISAAKFKEFGASLGVVAKEFSKLSEQIQEHLTSLTDFVNVVSQGVQKCALQIVALDTQMMMVDFFIRESIEKMKSSENAFADMIDNRQNFAKLFTDYANTLGNEISSLEKHLIAVSDQMLEVKKFTTGLEVIRQMGAVESARDNEIRQIFVHYLDEMKKFISLLQTSTQGIFKEMEMMQEGSQQVNATAALLSGRVDAIFNLASTASAEN